MVYIKKEKYSTAVSSTSRRYQQGCWTLVLTGMDYDTSRVDTKCARVENAGKKKNYEGHSIVKLYGCAALAVGLKHVPTNIFPKCLYCNKLEHKPF